VLFVPGFDSAVADVTVSLFSGLATSVAVLLSVAVAAAVQKRHQP